MYQIIKGKEITRQHVKQALELDFICYNDEYHLDYDKCYGYLDKNNYIYVMLLSDDKVIGYINFSPINDIAYNRIYHGEKDNFLTFDEVETYDFSNIESNIKKEYNLYFSSIVLHPAYRKKGLSNVLIEGLVNHIKDLQDMGIKIKRILADCVSYEGELMVSKLGLKKIAETSRGTSTYECYINPFNGNITKYNERLFKK